MTHTVHKIEKETRLPLIRAPQDLQALAAYQQAGSPRLQCM